MSCAESVTDKMSFKFSIILKIRLFLFIRILFLINFKLSKYCFTFLWNRIIPIVPKYDNCNPTPVMAYGFCIKIMPNEMAIDVQISFFLYTKNAIRFN